jgi:uncharacterized RDD family membrane protein YckC
MVIKEMCGHAVGAVVNPIVEVLDVEGVVQRIPVNDLLDRVDLNDLLDRIDWNRQLARIDFDAVLRHVDINEVVQRSDIGAIMAHSTSGVFESVLDIVRTQIVQIDLIVRRFTRLHFFDGGILPPKPGQNTSTHGRQRDHYPHGRFQKAIAMQGRYSGFVPKAVAIFIDLAWISVGFAIVCILLKLAWVLFLNESQENANNKVRVKDNMWILGVFAIFWFSHFFGGVAIAGRTIGMAFVGCKVVDTKTGREEDVTVTQALIRTILLPVTLTLFPPLGAVGFLRRDGRMLHDLVAGTGIIYSWDAKMAHVRNRAQRRMEQQTFSSSSISTNSSVSVDDDNDRGSVSNHALQPLLDDTGRQATYSSTQSGSSRSEGGKKDGRSRGGVEVVLHDNR